MKYQTFAIEDTQTLPRTSPDSRKFDKTKYWKRKKKLLDPSILIYTEFTALFPTTDIIALMTTKCLFMLAWNHSFWGLYLLSVVNAFGRRRVFTAVKELCSKQICTLLPVQRDQEMSSVYDANLYSAAPLRWPFFLQILNSLPVFELFFFRQHHVILLST